MAWMFFDTTVTHDVNTEGARMNKLSQKVIMVAFTCALIACGGSGGGGSRSGSRNQDVVSQGYNAYLQGAYLDGNAYMSDAGQSLPVPPTDAISSDSYAKVYRCLTSFLNLKGKNINEFHEHATREEKEHFNWAVTGGCCSVIPSASVIDNANDVINQKIGFEEFFSLLISLPLTKEQLLKIVEKSITEGSTLDESLRKKIEDEFVSGSTSIQALINSYSKVELEQQLGWAQDSLIHHLGWELYKWQSPCDSSLRTISDEELPPAVAARLEILRSRFTCAQPEELIANVVNAMLLEDGPGAVCHVMSEVLEPLSDDETSTFKTCLKDEMYENSSNPLRSEADPITDTLEVGTKKCCDEAGGRLINKPYDAPYPISRNKCPESDEQFFLPFTQGDYVRCPEGEQWQNCVMNQLTELLLWENSDETCPLDDPYAREFVAWQQHTKTRIASADESDEAVSLLYNIQAARCMK